MGEFSIWYPKYTVLLALIGLKNLASPAQPIATWSHSFSRAFPRLRVFASFPHWFITLFAYIVIDTCMLSFCFRNSYMYPNTAFGFLLQAIVCKAYNTSLSQGTRNAAVRQ